MMENGDKITMKEKKQINDTFSITWINSDPTFPEILWELK